MEKRKNNGFHRSKGNRICIIVVIFIASLLFLTLAHHCNDFLGMGKQSWANIFQDSWLYILGALLMTIAFYLKFF